MFRKSTLLLPLIFAAFATISTVAQAQTDPRPAFSLFRWLGNGYSDGYHTRNPGPDSRYYNPYSLNNSNRVVLPTDSSPVYPIRGLGVRQPTTQPALQSSWATQASPRTATRAFQARSVLVNPERESPSEQPLFRHIEHRRPHRTPRLRRR